MYQSPPANAASSSTTTAAADTLLDRLTEPQRQAVTHVDGPLLVLAGPGSGKTRVITRRAAYLARHAADARHILAITFTNKAAQEMRDRIEALGASRDLLACTFHAFCARILRIYADAAGLDPNFTIFDRDDRRKVIKEAIEVAELSATNWSPARVDALISRAKNTMRSPDAFEAEAAQSGWQQRSLARLYRTYQSLLDTYHALDFDDLLMRVALLLGRDRPLRDHLEDRYRYVLIDEYQDTNAAQYEIARLLTAARRNLCATGDPDQSIYGWRGADIGNILSFERDYPNAKVVRLEQNYRSTPRILAAADALIAANVRRKHKTLWTENEEGPQVRVASFESGNAEAAWLAADIAERVAEGASPADVAVFYRINAQSRALEEALLRRGVAYQIARGLEFYARKEIKDVLAYLNVLLNPADEVSLTRILNTPARGIGATTLARLRNQAQRRGRRLYDVIAGDEGEPDGLGRSAARVQEFAALLRSLRAELGRPPHEVIETVVSRTGLRAMYGGEDVVDKDPIANIDELITAARDFERQFPGATLIDWLQHTSLLSDVDGVKDLGGAVTLMTLHAAKGLEFPVVYVVGLEDGTLPLKRNDDRRDDADVEEERRLLFVGMTRARRRLTLTLAKYRLLRGQAERRVRSPFLDDLPEDGIEWLSPDGTPAARRGQAASAASTDARAFFVGGLVRHRSYGLGKIMATSGGPGLAVLSVYFQDEQTRTLVAEFAELEHVDPDDVDE